MRKTKRSFAIHVCSVGCVLTLKLKAHFDFHIFAGAVLFFFFFPNYTWLNKGRKTIFFSLAWLMISVPQIPRK